MTEGMKFNPDDASEREAMDKVVNQLEKYNATIVPNPRNVGAFEYKISFPFEDATVTMDILLKEWQTNSDVVIATMSTTAEKKSHGFGSKALRYILDWALENHFNEVRATQVSNPDSERFWVQNGFVKGEGPNPTSDLIFRL